MTSNCKTYFIKTLTLPSPFIHYLQIIIKAHVHELQIVKTYTIKKTKCQEYLFLTSWRRSKCRKSICGLIGVQLCKLLPNKINSININFLNKNMTILYYKCIILNIKFKWKINYKIKVDHYLIKCRNLDTVSKKLDRKW